MKDKQVKIEFRRVRYLAGDSTILDGIDVDIHSGETLVLLGESGCGKTTTLKMINRLLDPTDGEVLVDGRSTKAWDATELRRGIGYVLQEAGLLPHFSVTDNVGLTPWLNGWSEDRRSDRIREMLDLVGLPAEKFGERFPHELSGGQRQRVGLARALAADPEILLFDEPFGALDAITRSRLQREFSDLVRSLMKTVVFVTHDLQEAMRLADRIALMERGKIILTDTPDGFAKSDAPLARAYLDTVMIPHH
ncbi:MAG TPA: ATP-binding cassette domain-containing protein [Pyrinomonadaceae bacterium]|nr:ATP-binding cassette domain-containing protein [Pyrinomonadaceae bacterium]